MSSLLEDLRFLIGSFFLIIGLILCGQGFAHPSRVEGWNLDLAVGAAFVVFSAVTLGLALMARKEAAP